MYGIEDAARTAQRGGVGIIVYYRKEGRALGEVTKFLVYNARKRQEGGDTAATYFHRTECVAGTEDARFQELMPDCLHFFGITKIHNLHSMSNMKYDAIVGTGIEVVNRISIPDNLIPLDAQVEMEAKKAAGYFTDGPKKTQADLKRVKGRAIDE
jgi:GTP cyclohydrolase II